MKAGISAIAHFLPDEIRSSEELESLINANSTFSVSKGTIEQITGIKTRRVASKTTYNSTLAAAAGKKLLKDYGIDPKNIDLLIFAATGQDILEPATSHIIQAEIGTTCPVMDITNACNSFINALEVANSFIKTGDYRSILIVTGEVPSKSAKFKLRDRADFKNSFPGFSFGDAGTAVLVDAACKVAAIEDMSFFADSTDWDVAMLPGGGSRFLDMPDSMFFVGDGAKLAEPFLTHAPALFKDFLKKNNLHVEDIDRFFIHQVALPYLKKLLDLAGIDERKIEITIVDYGNVAAATLPLGISLSLKSGAIKKGQRGICIGLAGGVSIGFALLQF
jgi:3-oxoacyl-(acyl-carrier-protein) synthase III